MYNKFVVALVGAGIVILGRHFGVANPFVQDVIDIATALGVYAVANRA